MRRRDASPAAAQAGPSTEFEGTIALKRLLILVLLALIAPASHAQIQAQPAWTQAGVLTCRLNPSIGFIVAGHQSMECSYLPAGPFPPQPYQGAFNIVGLNVGVTAGGILSWTVFAPTSSVATGALAREYFGASGDVGLGVGVGANILLGGSGRSFALQPLSVEGSVAVNIAVGVSMLTLRAV
jgi:hypothetical protein